MRKSEGVYLGMRVNIHARKIFFVLFSKLVDQSVRSMFWYA